MIQYLIQVFEKRIVLFLWLSNLIINSIALLLAYIYIPETGKVTLKYNIVVGSLFSGQPGDLYSLPVFAFFIFGFNTLLYFLLKKTNSILPTLAIAVSLIVSVIFLFALIMLLQFNS